MTDPFQEIKGLNRIDQVCTDMSAIWRPTPCHDVGIDGQIEFLEPGTHTSTGVLWAVQSKSGPSWFGRQDDSYVYLYPKERHRRYWRILGLPVLLILHNPDTNTTLYARVKPQLRESGPILVSKRDVFVPSCRSVLLMAAREDSPFRDPFAVLSSFKRITLDRDAKLITGVEFLIACCNLDHGFFELRMCRITSVLELLSENGISIGPADYDFILRCVMVLHANKITEDFLNHFNEMWFELHCVPDVSVPLTALGKDVITLLLNNAEGFISLDNYKHLEAANAASLVRILAEGAQAASDHVDLKDRLAEEPR